MANTIQDKLAYLEQTKRLIKEAIVAKNVSVSEGDTFRSYADKITSIQAGGSIASAPPGIKFSNSTFTTVPTEIIPYLEQQADLSGIFENCNNLTTVPLFDTSKATNTTRMFESCDSLQKISLFDTSRVTSMENMFYGCRSLQKISLFDTSRVTNMSYMLSFCRSLTELPLFDTSSVTTMDSMLWNCSSLKTVPLLRVPKLSIMYSIFVNCSSLTNLGGFTGLKVDLDLSSSSKLTIDSVMNVINNAADMTSEPKTLKLHKDVFNKLSQEQIATASAKGWNIAAR